MGTKIGTTLSLLVKTSGILELFSLRTVLVILETFFALNDSVGPC